MEMPPARRPNESRLLCPRFLGPASPRREKDLRFSSGGEPGPLLPATLAGEPALGTPSSPSAPVTRSGKVGLRKEAHVIEFALDGVAYVARVVSKRPVEEDPQHGMTHCLEYIEGDSGREWVCLNEARNILRDKYGHDCVPYEVRGGEEAPRSFADMGCISRGTVQFDGNYMEQVEERIQTVAQCTQQPTPLIGSPPFAGNGASSSNAEAETTGKHSRKIRIGGAAASCVLGVGLLSFGLMLALLEAVLLRQHTLFDQLEGEVANEGLMEKLREDMRWVLIGANVGATAILAVVVAAGVCIGRLLAGCVAEPLTAASETLRKPGFVSGKSRRHAARMRPSRIVEVTELQSSIRNVLESISMFSRYLPPSVVHGIMDGDERTRKLHVSRREVTIMFSDLQDFTIISESVSQMDLLFILTRYLSLMTNIVECSGGVVSEILGDGLLVFWNTPDDVREHADKACATVLLQQEVLRTVLNPELEMLELPTLVMRAGVHTGSVLSGTLGSQTRMKFGCMGDPVNLASRLEGLCKVYGVTAMCSGSTVERLRHGSELFFRQLDLVQVKGKSDETSIYELMGLQRAVGEGGQQARTRKVSFRTLSRAFEESVAINAYESTQLEAEDGDGMDGAPSVQSFGTTREEPVDLLTEGLPSLPAETLAYAARYEAALRAYQEGLFGRAAQVSEALAREQPGDRAAQRLHERAARCERLQMTERERREWSGVTIMNEK